MSSRFFIMRGKLLSIYYYR